MASGWWESTHENLAAGSPIDFAVTTGPSAPRGYPKLASIATGAGLFLGGTPCVNIDDVMFYAGDSYTQDTGNPPLMRWDGRVGTMVLEVPPVGATPAKAILSICTDEAGNFYYSTWDSGTTSTTFAGRVYKFAPSTGVSTQFGSGLYTAGRLPYCLKILEPSTLFVGMSNQNPNVPTITYYFNTVTGIVSYVQDNSTTTTYQVTALQTASNTESGPSTAVSVATAATLDADAYNTITWSAPTILAAPPTVTPTIVSNAAVAGQFRNNSGSYYFRYSYSSAASASSTASVTTPSSFSTAMLPTVDFRAIDVTVTHSTDPAVKWIHFHFNHTGVVPTGGYIEATGGGSVANNIAGGSQTFTVTLTGATNLVSPYPTTNTSVGTVASYRVYRTAGHSSVGRIGSPTATTFIDDGDAGDASSAPAANAITAPTISSVVKRNPLKSSGAVGVLESYSDNIYMGMYQVAGTFPIVHKITEAGVISTSETIAPGGTARSYNGFTSSVVFGSNLYMGYWNDDTTPMALIRKFNGTTWSTVRSVTGANARPFLAFYVHGATCYAVAGGDAKDAFLYSTTDGTTWTDRTALLPTGEEGIPFIGTANVLGGF